MQRWRRPVVHKINGRKTLVCARSPAERTVEATELQIAPRRTSAQSHRTSPSISSVRSTSSSRRPLSNSTHRAENYKPALGGPGGRRSVFVKEVPGSVNKSDTAGLFANLLSWWGVFDACFDCLWVTALLQYRRVRASPLLIDQRLV